jgi:hypothetical protein
MAALALSSVLVVLFFHRPDEDRANEAVGSAPEQRAAIG